MKEPKVHYVGGVVYKNGNRLKGWPVCCTGERAININRTGKTTIRIGQVTCKACQNMLEKQRAYKKEQPEYWEKMRNEGYCL